MSLLNSLRRVAYNFELELLKSNAQVPFEFNEEDPYQFLKQLTKRWLLLKKYSPLLVRTERVRFRAVRFNSAMENVDTVLYTLSENCRVIKKGDAFVDNQVYAFTVPIQVSLDEYHATTTGRLAEPVEVPMIMLERLTGFVEAAETSKNTDYYYRINLRLIHELGRYTSAMEDLARNKR